MKVFPKVENRFFFFLFSTAQWSYGYVHIHGIFTWNLNFWADETATDVQWKNSLLQSHSCRSGQPCSLFLIRTTQDHSSYVYGQYPIVEGEYLHKSRTSVQWKLQIWGRKCRLKHLFLYQFAGCLIWPHFRKIECSCLSEVDIACVTLIMGGVNYIYCYPIWRFQNDGNRVDWVRDIFSSWGNTIPLVKLPSLVSLHCILSGQQRI